MLPLIARAAAMGGKAKKAAKSARPRKKGDDSTNARKRYYRSAERNLKKAEASTGATSAKYRQLAKMDFEAALDTYDPSTTQNFSQPIKRLANEFGVDLESRRKEFITSDDETRRKRIRQSENVLESALQNPDIRREREARALLNNDKIGSRILGGLVDVWRDAATVTDEMGRTKVDTSKILPTLFEYFNVTNLADMLQKLEKAIGDRLYKDEDSESMYEAVKLVIQTKVAGNTLVQ